MPSNAFSSKVADLVRSVTAALMRRPRSERTMVAAVNAIAGDVLLSRCRQGGLQQMIVLVISRTRENVDKAG